MHVSLVLPGMFLGTTGPTVFESQWLDVQHHNLDPFFCQQHDRPLPNAIATSSDNDYLLIPVIFVALPIVQYPSIQYTVEPARKPEIYKQLQTPDRRVMASGQILTSVGIACE